MKAIPWILIGAGLLSACAANRFGKLYPGMTQDQVVKAMEKGPSEAQQFKDGYAAWYFGGDQCILFQDEKVVSKAESKEKNNLEVWGLGGLSEKKPAECLPPGEKSTKKVEREIETPFGSLRR